MFQFAGIKRSSRFSPNHRGNDNAIFTLTAEALQKLGCRVNVYTEDELLLADRINEPHLFTMARSKQSVQRLQQLQREGRSVVNSGFAIENCYRAAMTSALIDAGVPFPKSYIVPTHKPACNQMKEVCEQNFWIKRGDFHAIHKEDVSFAHTAAQAADILKEYHVRGISEAVISEHLFGDLVKFYGVRGTDFFYWFYPYEFNHSKYNAEAVNGAASYYDFDEVLLKNIGRYAAEALDVDIYGGDAVISKEGAIHLIDFNDWPSFAPCRDDASLSIAQRIYQKAEAHVKAVSFNSHS